jgi:hypothetical protein
MLGAMDAKPLESDAIDFRSLGDERDLPNVYLPPPEEIEALKRQIREENDAREARAGSPPHLNMYRHPRILKTDYSQGRVRKSAL